SPWLILLLFFLLALFPLLLLLAQLLKPREPFLAGGWRRRRLGSGGWRRSGGHQRLIDPQLRGTEILHDRLAVLHHHNLAEQILVLARRCRRIECQGERNFLGVLCQI